MVAEVIIVVVVVVVVSKPCCYCSSIISDSDVVMGENDTSSRWTRKLWRDGVLRVCENALVPRAMRDRPPAPAAEDADAVKTDTADLLLPAVLKNDGARLDGADRGRGMQIDSSAILMSAPRGLTSRASLEQLLTMRSKKHVAPESTRGFLRATGLLSDSSPKAMDESRRSLAGDHAGDEARDSEAKGLAALSLICDEMPLSGVIGMPCAARRRLVMSKELERDWPVTWRWMSGTTEERCADAAEDEDEGLDAGDEGPDRESAECCRAADLRREAESLELFLGLALFFPWLKDQSDSKAGSVAVAGDEGAGG